MIILDPTQVARPARVWFDTPFFDKLCKDDKWIGENKKNGWRCVAYVGNNKVELMSRHGKRILNSRIENELISLGNVVLDGEIIKDVYYVFDIIIRNDDLILRDFSSRRKILEKVITETNTIRLIEQSFSKKELYEKAIKTGDEGIVFKRLDSLYPFGKTKDWIKCRTSNLSHGR